MGVYSNNVKSSLSHITRVRYCLRNLITIRNIFMPSCTEVIHTYTADAKTCQILITDAIYLTQCWARSCPCPTPTRRTISQDCNHKQSLPVPADYEHLVGSSKPMRVYTKDNRHYLKILFSNPNGFLCLLHFKSGGVTVW